MGSQQFAGMVEGTGGVLATTTQGTVQTDNFGHGGDFICGGDSGVSYPISVNPSEVIHEFSIIKAGDIDVRVTTTGGDTFTLRMGGKSGVWDQWDVDKLIIDDPRGTGALLTGGWAGE